METLQIFLLGSPEVVWKGEAFRLPRPMSRALLFYLALTGRASRSKLRALFWPDEADDGKARANLRVALARLRAGLPDPDLLDVDNDTITLARDRVSVDAVHFLELAKPALRAAALISLQTVLPERLAQNLRQAASLWRAPRFLPGFSFAEDSPSLDQWQLATTQQLEGLYIRVITRLADHFSAAGDFDSALSFAQDGLQADPLADDLHIRTLRWLQALGRTTAAAAHAQSLPERFAQESLEISDTLAALIRQVRQGGAAAAIPEAQGWPVAHLTRVPLVGRAGQLQSLQGGFRRGGMVLLLGEAGVGKTRLAYEFYRSLQPRPRLLLLNCLQGENNLPFQPLSDALRRAIRQEEWRRLKPAWLQQLARLLPELSEPRPARVVDATVPLELQRSYIFEALRHLLLDISRSGRLLVVLDGAQWCDAATLAALAYLNQRHLFTERGMLLVVARSEEPNPVLEHWTAAEHGAAGFQQVNLPALDPSETAELAQRVLDQAVPEDVAQRLAEDTGGNPLFLLGTLFALLDNSPTAGLSAALAQLPVGGSLHNLLRQRLARLHPVVRQVAAAASVLRAEFTPALLVEVAQLDLETVAQALDELQRVHLIQPVPGRPAAAYSFIHGQIREVIHWEQGVARLRLLHARAARGLAAQADASQRYAARLAYHYEQAGDLLAAFQCWLQAGRHARGLLAIREALQAFQAAERLVPILKEMLSDETLYELYAVWGETSVYDMSNLQFKEQLFNRLLQLGEERQSPLLIGGALSELAHVVSFQKDPARALQNFRQAAYQLEALANPLPAAQNDYRQGWFLMRLMRYADAALLLEKALARLEEAAPPVPQELRVNLEYRLGMVYLLTGWPARARQLAESALRQTPSPGAVYGHLVMAGAMFYLGQHPAALEHVRQGSQLAVNLTSWRMQGLFTVFQLRIELAIGEIDTAWKHAQAAAELARNHQMSDVLCNALMIQGDIYRVLGDAQAALRAYQAALVAGEGRWDSLGAQFRLGMALVDLGQPEEGLRQVEEAYSAARRIDLGEIYLPAMTAWALLLARTGRLEDALAMTQSWTWLAQERRHIPSGVVRVFVLSLDAIRRGDEREVRSLVDAVLQTARELSNPMWELQGYHTLARLGPLAKPETARVQELLDLMARRVRDPELRPLVETFLRRNRAALLGVS